MVIEPKDVREMRKMIHAAARGERVDGEPSKYHISLMAPLIRAVLYMGEHDGWSNEDTMTMLAYYALKGFEQAQDRELERLANSPPPAIFWRSL